jgi:hypothetical protein
MDPISNPYTPGAGVRPYELVGRAEFIDGFDLALQRSSLRLAARSKVLYGLRGVGKTVLLQEFVEHARRSTWLVVDVEAQAGQSLMPVLAGQIFRELRNAGRTWSGETLTWVRRVFKAFSLEVDPGTGAYSFGVDIEPARGYADSGDPDRDLTEMLGELASLAGHHGVGLLLAIDELQEVDGATLSSLNTTVHRMGQGREPSPFLFVGAGLPSLRRILSDATSYAERLFEYWEVGPLSDYAIRSALDGPAAAMGMRWEPAALDAGVEFCRGYPYFAQVLGQHVWDGAEGVDITRAAVAEATRHARRDIDAGLYAARWQRATRGEQRFMQAMADRGGGPVLMSDLVEALGKNRPAQLSPTRNQLINKGLVYAPDRGEVDFTVPGMAGFVKRQVVS